MRKLLCTGLTALIIMAANLSVNAADYRFGTTYDKAAFGKPSTSEVAQDYSATENIRRDKNAAYYPPSYGVFSGEFDTDLTSLYHTQDKNQSAVVEITSVGFYGSGNGEFLTSTSTVELPPNIGMPNVAISYTNIQPSQRINTVARYEDGSIGSISIPKLGVNVKVYPGTELSVLKIGVGHFDNTSEWDSNVGLASHNRGSASYFNGIWNLNNGDIIKYTTKEGTRIYAVYSKEKILETDQSGLFATSENTLTLITCVINQQAYRWQIKAAEIK